MCLDTMAANNSMYMHVSKPPKEGSPASAFFKELKSVAEEYPTVTVEGKKHCKFCALLFDTLQVNYMANI